MCQNTKGKVDGPGTEPGASTVLTTDSKREKEGDTEQCSVESATALPLSDTQGGLVGEGKALPPPTVFWCLDCLDDGVHTALALDGPSRQLCEFHRAERVKPAGSPDARDKCARKGCVRNRAVGSVFCTAHRTCLASVSLDNVPAIPEEAEQPNDRQPFDDAVVIREAIEAAWVALAEDSRLDPVTVAACKRLRDLEWRL